MSAKLRDYRLYVYGFLSAFHGSVLDTLHGGEQEGSC